MTRRALVLGAGGYAAYAWEIGIIVGMADAGLDVRNADLFVGTSAGSRVAVLLASGHPLLQYFQLLTVPSEQAVKPTSSADMKQLRASIASAKEAGGEPAEILKRVGRIALSTPPASGPARRAFVASQLPTQSWPSQRISIVAVNTETGERVPFDSNSGICLVDAVTASGAVAGIYPPVEFRGHHFMDGGFYSSDNADLAAGFDRIIVLALRAGNPRLSVVSLESSVEELRQSGARNEVIHPDQATEAAFSSVGGNLFDPAVAAPAARAAREQGHRLAIERLKVFWQELE